MRLSPASVAIVMLLTPLAATAQQRRFAIEPSLEVTQVHDDNLNFADVDPMRDRIRRVTPALALRLESPRWSTAATYAIDSERFATHSGLNNDRARERAALTIHYQPAPRLSVAMVGSYVDTNTLADLNLDTGLASSRIRGRQVSFGPTMRMRVSPRLTASASASMITTNVADGTGMRTQSQTLAFERRASLRDRVTVRYGHDYLEFDGENAQAIDSHVIHAGWSRDFGAHTHLSVSAGPRFTDGSPTADIAASISHDRKSSSIELALLRTQTTLAGQIGAIETESVQTKFTYAPARRLTAYFAPAWIRSTRDELRGTVVRMAAGTHYALTPLFGFDASYNWDRQNGAIDRLRSNSIFSHATLSLGFTTRWSSGAAHAAPVR